MSEYEEKNLEQATDMVRKLTNFVNAFGCPKKEFAKVLMHEHRTLQQSTFDLFLACIAEWAKQENYDLRNEATVKTCQQIVKMLDGVMSVPCI